MAKPIQYCKVKKKKKIIRNQSSEKSEILPYCFPGGSDGKESACNAGDLGSIPGSRRFPGGGNGNLLQYSCMENSVDRGAWRATVQGLQRLGHNLVTKQQQQEAYIQKICKLWIDSLIHFHKDI